ncbi:MAG: hypothetical protein R2828_31370 [Saprospiraceae bacterium]
MAEKTNQTVPLFQTLIIIGGIFSLFFNTFFGIALIGLGFVLIVIDLRDQKKELEQAVRRMHAREDFIFTITNADSELKNCKNGEQVNWWAPEDKSKIIFYKRGTIGGDGKVGEVPTELVEKILELKEQENQLSFFISGVRVHGKIKKQEVIREELRLKTEEEREKLIKMFDRKYKPKGSIAIGVQHDLPYKLLKFTEAKMEIKEKEFFINHPNDIFIDFIIDGVRIRKDNEKQKLLRIIRTHFEGYEQKVELIDSQHYNVDLIVSPTEKKDEGH